MTLFTEIGPKPAQTGNSERQSDTWVQNVHPVALFTRVVIRTSVSSMLYWAQNGPDGTKRDKPVIN